MTPTFRGGRALVASTALALVALTTSPLTAPASAAAHDPAPGDAGAAWLTGQLTGGLIVGQYGPDYGLSIDTALGLAGLGGHDATVQSVSDAVAAHINDYIAGDAFGDVGSTYAGAVGKAMVLAQTVGDDPHTYGGVDLVARLESRLRTAPTGLGRIVDKSSYGDYANVIGQAFAAEGLAAAGSTHAVDATHYLLEQQCSGGYFRLYFTKKKTAADQSCDGGRAAGDSAPDTDVTALAVLALQAQAADPVVSGALDRAEAWLKKHQSANGSFGGGPATEAPNTNSTGLAGWALGSRGATTRATRAAVWVRQHQLVNVGACSPYAAGDLGAAAYDATGLAGARRNGITDATADQFRRASSQSLAVLQWAPMATGARTSTAGDRRFWQARRPAAFSVTGAAPGDALCTTLGTRHAQAPVALDGGASVQLPAGTGLRVFHLTGSAGSFPDVAFHALGRLEVPFDLAKQRVSRGGTETVRVRGLERRERVTVLFRGHRVDAGRADADGRFTARFGVGRTLGDGKVVVRGQFPTIRHNGATLTVTR